MQDFEIGKASISGDVTNPAIQALNREVAKSRVARIVPPSKVVPPLRKPLLWRLRATPRPGPLH